MGVATVNFSMKVPLVAVPSDMLFGPNTATVSDAVTDSGDALRHPTACAMRLSQPGALRASTMPDEPASARLAATTATKVAARREMRCADALNRDDMVGGLAGVGNSHPSPLTSPLRTGSDASATRGSA